MTPAFGYASFRRLWAAAMTSMMGFWMLSVTQGWLVVELTESPFMLGLLAFFRSVPMLLLSPMGGVLADRVPRTRLLLVAQGLMGTADLAVGILVLTNRVEWWHLAVSGMMIPEAVMVSSSRDFRMRWSSVGLRFIINRQ